MNGKPGNPYGLSQLKPGDVVTIDAAGGGGYGDPLAREVARVEADVRDGIDLIMKRCVTVIALKAF